MLLAHHDESPHDQDAVDGDTRSLASDGLAKSANNNDHLRGSANAAVYQKHRDEKGQHDGHAKNQTQTSTYGIGS